MAPPTDVGESSDVDNDQQKDSITRRLLWPTFRLGPLTVRPLVAKSLLFLLALAWLVRFPQAFDRTSVNKLSDIICFAIAVMGLNLLTGVSGQISVGHGAFYGVGAFGVIILVADYGVPYFGALAILAIVCFVLGLLVGLPALRIEGVYLALTTLAFATLFPNVISRFPELFGQGTTGRKIDIVKNKDVYGFNRPPEWAKSLGFISADDQWRFYVILTAAVVAFLLVRNITRSRIGRALVAIRDNEVAAEVAGVHLAKYKVIAFGLSAMLAGVAGGLLAFRSGGVTPSEFTIATSIALLVAVVVGGAGSTLGPWIGAYLTLSLVEWLPDGNEAASPALFGIALVVLMGVAPGGIAGLARKTWGIARVRVSSYRRAAA